MRTTLKSSNTLRGKKPATIAAKEAGLKRAEVRNAEREAEAIRRTAKIKDFSGRRP